MTSKAAGTSRILGSLRAADGKGAVSIQDRFETGIDDLWSALTDPGRLARWLGEVEGDLRLGGTFTARFFASGWEGTGTVVACEPPHRFAISTADDDVAEEHLIEATLRADGEQTVLTIEERGMPLGQLAAYGAGVQIHVEDLASYLAGQERGDAQTRWAELMPAYEELAANIS